MTIQYQSGLLITGTNADRTGGTWTNLAAGWKFLETDTLNQYYWNGTAWNIVGGRFIDKAISNTDSPYTALATDQIIRANATSGNITVNLPSAVGIAGTEYHIFRTDVDMSTNIITVDPNGSETIGGTPTCLIYSGEFIKIESDGANWQVLDRPTPTRHGYYFLKGATANKRYAALHNYVVNSNFSASTTSPTSNTLYAAPMVVSKPTKFDVISFRVNTLSTAGSVRVGIYYDNGNCYPGALMFDSGAIDTSTGSTTAPRDSTITAALQIFQPGLYWLVWETNSATGQYATYNVQSELWYFAGSDAVLGAVNNAFGYTVTHTFGALPDPYTAGGSLINTAPAVTAPFPVVGLRPV